MILSTAVGWSCSIIGSMHLYSTCMLGPTHTLTRLLQVSLPCTQECVIVNFHYIMNMHDQFMGMNSIQQPFLSCLPAFYALATPMSCYISCYISNVFYYLFVFCVLFVLARRFFLVSQMTANIYLRQRHSIISNLHSTVELSCCSN